MADAGGNPDASIGRDDPGPIVSLDTHHALGGVDELHPVMRMPIENRARQVSGCQAPDEERLLGLSHFRYFMAQSRKTVDTAETTSGLRRY